MHVCIHVNLFSGLHYEWVDEDSRSLPRVLSQLIRSYNWRDIGSDIGSIIGSDIEVISEYWYIWSDIVRYIFTSNMFDVSPEINGL